MLGGDGPKLAQIGKKTFHMQQIRAPIKLGGEISRAFRVRGLERVGWWGQGPWPPEEEGSPLMKCTVHDLMVRSTSRITQAVVVRSLPKTRERDFKVFIQYYHFFSFQP